jgi:type IV secretory pathway TrbL component
LSPRNRHVEVDKSTCCLFFPLFFVLVIVIVALLVLVIVIVLVIVAIVLVFVEKSLQTTLICVQIPEFQWE